MSTQYLKFADQSTAIAALTEAGYELSEYKDHCHASEGESSGEGTVFAIPDVDGHFVNVYECVNLPASLQQYVVPAPATPYNKIAE